MTSLLKHILAPLGLNDLRDHYERGHCLVLEGSNDKFSGLVELSDIERRLNDGCNFALAPQVIDGGQRLSLAESSSPWSPCTLKKTEFRNAVENGASFMMPNSSQISQGLARLCDELEQEFSEPQHHADVHLYVSLDKYGGSYNAHRDRPQHKLLLQAKGDVDWQLFEPKGELSDDVVALADDEQDSQLEVVSEFTLKQGDLLYMPPSIFHRVHKTHGPRVSISIPFYPLANAAAMDRHYIPFKRAFLGNDK